jgi:hypothetical protein
MAKTTAKKFKAPASWTQKITEGGKVVGTIRVRPSTIMWKPKSGQDWFGVTIEQFEKFAKKKGEKMDK